MDFPILSVIVFVPLIAGILILLYPPERKTEVRVTALAAAAISLLLSLWVFIAYDVQTAGYQFVEKIPWLPSLVLLTGLVAASGVLISWNIDDRPREFFAFMMFLVTSIFGVFVSLDLFQLFFFFEIAVFPKYLMIAIWGSPKTREYGAMKLTLYLFIGSVIALIGALALYFATPARTFDMLVLESAGFPIDFQRLWFPVIFFGFAILGGIFPFHSWAPDGHVAAPTAISMLLAGVEMKVGAFGALRVAIMLLPDGAKEWTWLILLLGTVNVVYGALIAMIQTDFKYVIGFSSVSHMGLVMMGFATLSREGLLGASMQMFSHGVMTALFFAVVGMVYDRAHTRDIGKLGGLFRKMPWAAVGFIVGGLVSMGMPGFSGFVAEFPIFMGVWRNTPPIYAIVAVLGIVITAAYILRVIGRVFFGETPVEIEPMGDVNVLDKVTVGMLAVIMIALGLFPILMTPLIQSGVDRVLQLVGGA
jgi:NADH-quinone oxidoreductase subunit M